jgi:hypothetical protein
VWRPKRHARIVHNAQSVPALRKGVANLE